MLSIHDNAEPALIVTTAAAEGIVREALPATKARLMCVDAALLGNAAHVPPTHPLQNADGIAFLQYTSGSTGAPKGTVITHANLLANLDAIQALFQYEPDHEFVSWLPPFHDMGLMGLLSPLYRGITVTLLPPEEFLRTPARWLQVISSRKAFVCSGAPNFAYHLLVDRVRDEEIAALDLSRWRVAFNGAEPVRAETLEHFAHKFAPCGFHAEAWRRVLAAPRDLVGGLERDELLLDLRELFAALVDEGELVADRKDLAVDGGDVVAVVVDDAEVVAEREELLFHLVAHGLHPKPASAADNAVA